MVVESKEKPQAKRWSGVIRRDGASVSNPFKEAVERKREEKQEVQDAYDYFYNLF